MAASTPEMFLSSNFNPSPNLDSLWVNPSYSLIQHIATQSSFHSALNQLLCSGKALDLDDRFHIRRFTLPIIRAQGLVAKITAIGGSLVNRKQLITEAVVLATKIVLNSFGFLRITQYHHDTQKHGMEDVNGPDSLGDTRIQFADYELARKMAMEALELDEEDIHTRAPFSCIERLNGRSRWVSVVQRISKQFVAVKLESGIEGIVNAQYIANIPDDPHKLVKKGQMVPSVIIDIKFDLDQDHVFVELSIREKELLDGGQTFRRVFHDKHWNHTRYEKDKDNLERKKRQQSADRRESSSTPTSTTSMLLRLKSTLRSNRGRCWHKTFISWQGASGSHFGDVTDRNPDPTGQSVGNQLVIEANHVELERMVRDGFIADEDEDEDDDKDKRRRRKGEEYEQMELEEDDLEFLEENTRISVRNGLSQLRRGRESDPPLAGTSIAATLSPVPDVQDLWDDDKRDDGDGGGMNMESFIEYSDKEDGQEGREERHRVQKQDAEQCRRAGGGGRLQSLQALTSSALYLLCCQVWPDGVSSAWDELHHVFGGGEDYNWALELDDEEEQEDYLKQDMKYQDIFETSKIQRRFLTDNDELVRARDIPERMQLALSSLSQSFSLALYGVMNKEDPGGAVMWVLKEKLALPFEHVLVDVTDAIGVNINGAMSDSYYNTLRA
ncbi:hypothetical protein BKA70DRAFT_1231792 [Coprinopsis sp. MPI-PUGE-AT-0042]|nr:hypothetical protein BKA70DRAFT_1231792 [Coprinopsis sp. MPI-PUGE-AT-0042]